MGNARWTGVPLRRVLGAAGVKAGAVEVRFNGLDGPATPDGPDFRKSLAIDHALDGEVMIAYAMNGEALPYLNGFPLRLVVPGWFSTYWVKMLSDVEVLAQPDDNYWMQKAYLIPNTPGASITPGQTGVAMTPIKGMGPRSFFTNLKSRDKVSSDKVRQVRGIAFGGTAGVARVELSQDQGRNWQEAQLGEDLGRYSFRRWTTSLALSKGSANLLVRCTNLAGETQPLEANWNASGYMRNVVERLMIDVV
jgi:DMSO/TMAO reductase YedYZ molybdopterin-dependent catalytic subunit